MVMKPESMVDLLRSHDESDGLALVHEGETWRVVRLPDWWIPALEIDAANGRVKHGPVPVIRDGIPWTRKPAAKERRWWSRTLKRIEAEEREKLKGPEYVRKTAERYGITVAELLEYFAQ